MCVRVPPHQGLAELVAVVVCVRTHAHVCARRRVCVRGGAHPPRTPSQVKVAQKDAAKESTNPFMHAAAG